MLGAQPSASLPAAAAEAATLKAASRFFDNDHIHADVILASHRRATTARLATVPLVLAVQEHRRRLSCDGSWRWRAARLPGHADYRGRAPVPVHGTNLAQGA